MARRPAQRPTKSLTYSKVEELMASPTEPLDESRRLNHLLRTYEGLRKLEEGDQPTYEDWLACSDAIGLVWALIEMGVAEDDADLLRDAMTALGKVGWHRPGATTGTPVVRLDGDGLVAVRQIIGSYADVLAQVPARTVIRAHRHMQRRMREVSADIGRATRAKPTDSASGEG